MLLALSTCSARPGASHQLAYLFRHVFVASQLRHGIAVRLMPTIKLTLTIPACRISGNGPVLPANWMQHQHFVFILDNLRTAVYPHALPSVPDPVIV